MFRYLYEWAQDLSVYLILITAVFHALPDSGYKKYIRFFTGLILMLLLLTPFLSLTGSGEIFQELYHGYEQDQDAAAIREGV